MKHVLEVCLIVHLTKASRLLLPPRPSQGCCGRSAWCLNSRAVLMVKSNRILLANPAY